MILFTKGTELIIFGQLKIPMMFSINLKIKTFRLEDLLNIDNIYFDQMVDRIYPTELQLNRANSSDTEAPFLDLNLCISNGTVPPKFMIKGTILILI